MAKIYDASLFPTKLDLLTDWMGRQRWYASSSTTPQLRRLGGYRLDDPEGEVGMETLVVADESGPDPVVYQVPLTYRAAPLTGAERALIGTIEHSVLGTRYVYDAPHDPVYTAQLLLLLCGQEEAQHASLSATPEPKVIGRPLDPVDVRRATASRVLAGEQSNTSIVIDTTGPAGAPASQVICKVFRVLQHGENPDVELQTALARAGSDLVPAPLGSVHGVWGDPVVEGAEASGPLAFASEFLPGTQDAWRTFLVAARRGEDFTERARALGEATASIHTALAGALEVQQARESDREALARSFHARVLAAVGEQGELSDALETIRAIEAAGVDADWPPLQRVHGDYHLGQVLDVPGRGWVVLDFEGEPLRPMNERLAPDLALRDVAGMLRSFDYVAGTLAQEASERDSSSDTGDTGDADDAPTPPTAEEARAWAKAVREAFLDGYAATGPDPRAPEAAALLAALELDKALYEVTYESRNRPTWVPIPVQAVRVLCSETPTPASTARRSVTEVSDQSPTTQASTTGSDEDQTTPATAEEANAPSTAVEEVDADGQAP
ncbi:MAG: 1,4-alpha-glucan branching enzyme, partial [Mobilicoccus sp.]|nr:1,4-alpha-glucan branching enzyme [Mobilicoccus sp.]